MPRRWNHPTWHAGVIPEAYKDVISDMEITEARKKVSDEPKAEEADELIYGTPEEMLKRAKKDTSSEIRRGTRALPKRRNLPPEMCKDWLKAEGKK